MAYINVAEWSPDQVTDWLKGLDNSMYPYINSFTNNGVRGQQLLNIRPYELVQLGMCSIGHQEIVLEAVEQLRNFHYHLDKENLQFLALHVATASQCLHNQLAHVEDKSKIETQILSDVTRTIATIKPLIGWLDRSPFHRINRFVELRNKMLRFAIEMATMAQRDRFVENPVDQIKTTALRVANLANYIIQDVSDVMILQPASLNLVTFKKKESELGFNIVPSYHGIHVITDIKYNSPAHTSGKIEDGDEIIQVNYQTVVGWHYKKVIQQLQESPTDILITLKKRPKHSKIYGQIYMKPYRLPSKKKVLPYRWGGGSGGGGISTGSSGISGSINEQLPSPRMILAADINLPSLSQQLKAKPQPQQQQQQQQQQQKQDQLLSIDDKESNNTTNKSSSSKEISIINNNDENNLKNNTENQNNNEINQNHHQRMSSDSDCSDILTPTDQKSSEKDLRLYLPKPRAVLQRRNTICWDHLTDFKSNFPFWHDYEHHQQQRRYYNYSNNQHYQMMRGDNPDSPSLRDKSVSFGFGLEIAPRPTTCLGIGTVATSANIGNKSTSGLQKLIQTNADSGVIGGGAGDNVTEEDEGEEADDDDVFVDTLERKKSKPGISKVVRFDSGKKITNNYIDNEYACNIADTVLEVFEPIPYVDDEEDLTKTTDTVVGDPTSKPISPINYNNIVTEASSKSSTSTASASTTIKSSAVATISPTTLNCISRMTSVENESITQAVNEVLINRQQLKWNNNKNISTTTTTTATKITASSADSSSDSDVPPAIEPRIEFLLKTPPAPPPRPRKLTDSSPTLKPPTPIEIHVVQSLTQQSSPPQQQQQQQQLQNQPPLTYQKNNKFIKPNQTEIIEDNRPKTATVIDLKSKTIGNGCSASASAGTPSSSGSKQFIDNILEPPSPSSLSPDLCALEQTTTVTTPTSTTIAPPVTKHFLDTELSELLLTTPNKTKNLTLKKKNSILAKRRNLTLKTLEISDIQGHLYRRSKDKRGVTYWAKLYFVLADTTLYGFKSKDSDKANCLIFLNDFTVSPANEVHSKSFAFKVYHPTKTFYFAAESHQAMEQWMEYIKRATLKGPHQQIHHHNHHQQQQQHHHHNHHHHHHHHGSSSIAVLDTTTQIKDLFSETESSGDEFEFGSFGSGKQLGTPSPSSTVGRFSTKKNSSSSNNLYSPDSMAGGGNSVNGGGDSTSSTGTSIASTTSLPPPKPEKYHLGFGSLKKFKNLSFSSSSSKNKEKKSSSGDVPVPTAQFRSYRKVPGNAGLQLGTHSMISSSMGTNDFSPPMLSGGTGAGVDHTSPQSSTQQQQQQQQRVPPLIVPRKLSITSLTQQSPPPPTPTPTPAMSQINHSPQPTLLQHQIPTTQAPPPPPSPSPSSLIPTTTNTIITQQLPQRPNELNINNKFQKPIMPSRKKLRKTSPYNYIHASNPNLVEFDFPTSRALDYSFPRVNPSNSWDAHHSLQGLMTLKDLMLQKQEEDAKEMYNNRVNLGVEKKNSNKTASLRSQQYGTSGGGGVGGVVGGNGVVSNISVDQSIQSQQQIKMTTATTTSSVITTAAAAAATIAVPKNKIQMRSLPKTPDYAQSFKPDDSDIIMTRSREGQKLRDFGYEFISGDDDNSTTKSNTTRKLSSHVKESTLALAAMPHQPLKMCSSIQPMTSSLLSQQQQHHHLHHHHQPISVATSPLSHTGSLNSSSSSSSTPIPTSSSSKKKVSSGLNWINTERRLADDDNNKNGRLTASGGGGGGAGGAGGSGVAGAVSSGGSSGGSFKRSKNKLVADTIETFKSSSEKLLQFKSLTGNNNNNNNNNGGHSQNNNSHFSFNKKLPFTNIYNNQQQQQQQQQQQYNNPNSSHHNHNQHQHHGHQNYSEDENVMVHLPLVIGSASSSSSIDYGIGLKKSNTTDFKMTVSPSADSSTIGDSHRKNSAPTPTVASYFSKLPSASSAASSSSSSSGVSSSNKTAKEKKLLGSPRLHRVVFGRRSGGMGGNDTDSTTAWPQQHLDHEIFSPIDFKPRQPPPPVPIIESPSTPNSTSINSFGSFNHHPLNAQKLNKQQTGITNNSATPSIKSNFSSSTHSIGSGATIASSGSSSLSSSSTSSSSTTTTITTTTTTTAATPATSTDYPNLQYPPVFEAETYSLSDPNTSLTLMRRRNYNQSK